MAVILSWSTQGAAFLAIALCAPALWAASGATVQGDLEDPDPDRGQSSTDAAPLTPEELWYEIGVELARREVQLAELGVRMKFRRDANGEWFVQVVNRSTGCRSSQSVGSFDSLIPERTESIALAVLTLIQGSGCSGFPEAPKLSAKRPAQWVRPAAGVFAGASALALLGISQSDPPNLALSLEHAPSAYFSSALGVGVLGGTATLLVPETLARPTFEVSFFASGALLATAFSMTGEPGVPSYGTLALAGGYGATALLVGLDWTLSEPAAMLSFGESATSEDAPRRALSPWLRYSPAIAGSLVSMTPALSPDMDSKDRELVLGTSGLAVAPAVTALIFGLVDYARADSEIDHRLNLGSGPEGSIGMTIGGEL